MSRLEPLHTDSCRSQTKIPQNYDFYQMDRTVPN